MDSFSQVKKKDSLKAGGLQLHHTNTSSIKSTTDLYRQVVNNLKSLGSQK
jgi:hypothetical protein